MERSIRGDIENFIDRLTTEDHLNHEKKYWNYMREEGIIDSISSSIIGNLYGRIYQYYISRCTYYNYKPSNEELDIFLDIWNRRIITIKSKINKILNL